MFARLAFTALFCLFIDVRATPFDELENYIDTYEKGIKELLELGPKYAPAPVLLENRGQYNDSEVTDVPEEYDFIIVGAGAAGSVVANRLSEIPEWKILLLEAGGPEDEITRIPGYVLDLLGTKYNWGYKTIPQKNWCLGKPDKRCVLEMGKALGGSTVINGFLYTRGNPRDYDHWSSLGNQGWCFDDVLPYFLKIEDAHLKTSDKKFHRYGGKVHLENMQDYSPQTEAILKAAYELHIPFVDYNGKEQMGIAFSQGTTKRGKRWSAAEGYLKETNSRPNLVIKPFSIVTKVMINPHSKEAYGVKFLNGDKLYAAKARKEVIISAGAINTPKLLQLSGVGPKELLDKFNIQTLKNLKVGTPLRSHLGFPGLTFIYNNTKVGKRDQRQDLIDYLKNGRGPLAAIFTDLVAYMKTEVSKDYGNYPDVEILFVPFDHKPDHQEEGQYATSITIVLMRPKSFGSVNIASRDPLVPPELDINYLSDPQNIDIDTVVAATRLVQKFVKTQSFKKWGAYIDKKVVPQCKGFEYDSDSYWKCAVRHQSYSLRHPIGTAKMGPSQDREAVVDNHLNVYGVGNLRIVDNSIVPIPLTAHMMAPAYMIGEKGSDIIKEFWNSRG
ncbi:hypothetical protein WA026_015242 [Henosepilachna vigintioctopunctata]|uniref:Glucose-methanol-choline oxidoreductase N-terminal domain-containing protein n=1 Tax=Henosepilachna vigintioctopunctata TaxID=420089 RepID=A0AAW1TV75_9CUCU